MMNIKKAKILFIIISSLFIYTFAGVINNHTVYADSIEVYPSIFEITVEKGVSTSTLFWVENNSNQSVSFELEAVEIDLQRYVSDKSLNFIEDSDISQWVRFDSSFVNIDPDNKAEIKFDINIPTNVDCKTYFVGLKLMSKNNGNLNIDPIVVLNLSVVDKGALPISDFNLNLAANNHFLILGLFDSTKDITFSVAYKNIGKYVSKIRGKVEFFDQSMTKLSTSFSLNNEYVNILPGYERKEDFSFHVSRSSNNFLPVRLYKIVSTIYTSSNPDIYVQKSLKIWVVDIKFLVIYLSVIAAVISIFLYIRRRKVLKKNVLTDKK